MGNQLNCVTDKDDNVLITDQEAQISILMLGAGDGGKSTLVSKQQQQQ
jgi:GTPase SAR1 family protein